MKAKINNRYVAFVIVISMFVGLLCGNGYTVAASEEEDRSIVIEKQHEKDGYIKITPTLYQSSSNTYFYETPTVKDADINLILDAINTNYKYMEFKGSEIDIVTEYLGDMYGYFEKIKEKKEGDPYEIYFGDKTLRYKANSVGKGTLEFVNEVENIERKIDVDFYGADDGGIKAKLRENGTEIKDIVITKDNICIITNNNGKRYELSVEHESENSYYKITYSSIEDEGEYISFEKNKEDKYCLIATEGMITHYGLSLWYKEKTSEPTETPTETPTKAPTAVPTSIPTNKPDVTTSPLPSIKIKDSVTIKMGKSIGFDELIEGGDAKAKGKITVNTKNKCLKINKAKKEIKAKYTKKKLPKKGVLITVKVGKQTKKVHVKVIVPKPKKKDIMISSQLNGQSNKIMFNYKLNKNLSIRVKFKDRRNRKYNSILKKYIKGNKGYKYDKDTYITTSNRHKTIKFSIYVYCGKNKSAKLTKGVKLN